MKTVTSLLLVALLISSALSACVTRGPADSFVGDHTAYDQVLECSGNLQSVALPSTNLGGHDALTFEVEVFPRAFTGCVFAYGSGADAVELRFAADPNNGLGQVHFTLGSQTVSTGGILTANKWHNIAVVVRNNAAAGGVVSGAVATVYVDGITYPAGAVGALTSSARNGHLGYCPSNKAYFNGAIDNFIVSAVAKTAQQQLDTRGLIFPFVLENDLIQLWTFNDLESTTQTSAFTGFAAESLAVAALESTTDQQTSAVCTRDVKQKFAGARVTDLFCHQAGSVAITADSTIDSVSNVAPFQSAEGGLSQAFACAEGKELTFNQKWANGGVIEATLKTSLNHRFRIRANPDAALIVEHQAWGGWTRLSTGSGIINEDRSAYSISDTEFVVQAKGHGWVAIQQNGGFLAFQYALDTDSCTEATQCGYVSAQEFQYNFANPPLPEPMGNQETTEGIQDLPPVLACPTPTINGYNPFMYCWGWWVGPQVGYARDWNGNQWQTSDPACCRNTAILSSNQWSVQRWGHLIQGKTLPWCESMVVPPLTAPTGTTSIPTYPTDPCEGLEADVPKFKEICRNLWGNDEADGRFIGCVAQLCITKDPTTVPPPDCATERLLAKLDSNYQLPATCNECPAQCNFRGTCDSNKVCTCKTGWTGPSCGQPTEFPCMEGDGNRITPFQLKTLDPQFPGAPVLSISMNDPLYTQFAFPGPYAMADTLFIYMAQSINDFNGDVPRYHIWAVSNNGGGSRDLTYTVTITSATINANDANPGGAQLDIFGAATAGAGTGAGPAQYPKLDRPINADTFSINVNAQAGQQAGFVVRNVPLTFKATVSVTGASLPQVIIGTPSTSNKAKMDIFKVSAASATAGFQMGGLGDVNGNTKCTDNGCASLSCGACSAAAACGWCVETAQCQPGDRSGPSLGECLNWRYTFDPAITRRVTQIPSYPVNPGLTEVYVATGSDLPIGLAVTPLDYTTSEWDTLIFTDYGSEGCSRGDFLGQIQDVLSTASKFPNMGVAFASIVNSYETVQPLVNPRATDSIPKSIELLRAARIAPTTGLADIDGALAKLAGPVTSLGERRGTRKMALFMSGRNHDGVAQLTDAVKDALLKKDIVPVFAVYDAHKASYQTIVNTLGWGYVIQLSPFYSNVYRRALAVAGSSVTAIVYNADRTTTHIDYTSFASNIDRFSVVNVPTNFRAKFSIPVSPFGSNFENVLTTHIAFPSYSTALIENIPAALAEKPWTTFSGEVTTLDNNANGIVIDLTGMSFRGLMAVSPKILSLPAASQGSLFRAVRTVDNGEIKYIAGDAVQVNNVIADNRVIFKPVQGGAGSTSFTYEVFDKCINSAPGTVPIKVVASNQPPVADMPNMVTPMYTPLDFVLDFGDDKKILDGISAYEFTIVNTVNAARDGKLYKWYPNFNPEAPQASAEVTDGMVLDGSQPNRLIYMPKKFMYSSATRSELLTLPCFDYKVKELNTADAFESNVKQVLITVTHVNIAPFVWEDEAWPADLLGAWADVPAGVCYDNCNFQEDFGERYWWNAGFEMIYLGGNDVEGSILSYELTQIDCVQGTTLLLPLDNNRNAIVGDKMSQNEPGIIKPTLRFRPARETSDLDSLNSDGSAKGYYCKIGYRVIDDQEAVSNEKIITINVSPLNKQPRLEDEVTRIVALEQQKHQFFLSAIDPEGDAFSIKFLGCAKDQGVIEICNTHTCDAVTTIDCSQVYPVAPIALPNVQAGELVDGLVAPIQGFFTSGPVENFAEGQEYNTVYFSFDDGTSTFEATEAKVIFDVKIVNVAPVLFIQDQDTNDFSITLDVTTPFNPSIQIFDPDFDEFSFYQMTVEVTLDNTNAPAARLNVDALTARIVSCTDSAEVSATHFLYTCQLNAVNDVLTVLELLPPPTSVGAGDISFKVRANDNGNSGQCPELNFVSAQICPLEDNLLVQISFVQLQDTTAVTGIASAAAAGVAGAAAIGAVALFRRFNKKAEESYAPWDDNINDDSTAVNPLYEESGNKGVNPLFEAKTDL